MYYSCEKKLLFLTFFGLLFLHKGFPFKEHENVHYRKLHSSTPLLLSTPYKLKQFSDQISVTPNLNKKLSKIQRRDIPLQNPYLGIQEKIEANNGKQEKAEKTIIYPQLPPIPKYTPVKPLVKPNETEAERAERIHKSFERLLTFVEIVGQVDNYVSSKWKNLVRTVSNFYEVEDEPYHLSARRVYGTCANAQ